MNNVFLFRMKFQKGTMMIIGSKLELNQIINSIDQWFVPFPVFEIEAIGFGVDFLKYLAFERRNIFFGDPVDCVTKRNQGIENILLSF